MDVSENSGTPRSSILIDLIRFSIINHPFWGTPILETPRCMGDLFKSGTQKQGNFFLKPLFSGSMLVFKGVSHNEHLISVATNRKS